MLTIVFLPLLLAAPASSDATELAQAETFAASGERHLKKATTSAEHPITEFQAAHTDFDSAYLVDGATVYLCRALEVAHLALRTATFPDEQARLFWQETRQDDLDRLRQDAAETKRANCRFDAGGEPQRPRLAAMDDADFSLLAPPPASTPTHGDPLQVEQIGSTPMQRRRWNAQTAAGALFTGAGVGLIGVLAGAIGLQVRQAEAMRDIFDRARATGSLSDVDRSRAEGIKADSIQTRSVAIGVGIAGAVSLATGVGLLATRKKATRPVALLPYGGPFGGGAVLRMRF